MQLRGDLTLHLFQLEVPMKKYLFAAVLLSHALASAQMVLDLPEDYDPNAGQAAPAAGNAPAMKPLDQANLPDAALEEAPKATPSAPAAPRHQGTTAGSGTDPWGQMRDPRDGTNYFPPAPPAPVPNQGGTVLGTWIRTLDLCLPPEGMSRYRMAECPSYATASLRINLETRPLHSGLREFDQIPGRIFGTFRQDIVRETGIEAAACASGRGMITRCVVGRRNTVLNWIRGGR